MWSVRQWYESRTPSNAQCITQVTMTNPETRYPPLEKIILTLVIVAKTLQLYFQSHPMYVGTQHPIQAIFKRAEFDVLILFGPEFDFKLFNLMFDHL